MAAPSPRTDILTIILGKTIFATKYLALILAFVASLATPVRAADAPPPGPSVTDLPAEPPSEPGATPPTKTSPEPPAPASGLPDTLTIADCVKCHPAIVEALQKNGKAHRDKLTCQVCHIGHPPKDRDVIPLCSRCHQGKPHFELTGCLGCHTNPHTPLEITLTRTITQQCTTCHHGQLEQLKENPSIHTTLACTACHTRHGYRPPCYNCHKAHLEGMDNKLCQHCHKPHMPLVVSFPAETPSEYCGPCHPKVYALLAKSRAKHRNVLCAQCHAGRHKTIPVCQKCHPEPHSQSMLGPAPVCGKCHGKAHDLKLDKIDIMLDNQRQ